MTKGTKLRTIAFIIVMINQVLTSLGTIDLGNETANLVYRIFALVMTITTGVIVLYYNNDFTKEACKGTALTRYLKEIQSKNFVGEDFTKVGDDNE